MSDLQRTFALCWIAFWVSLVFINVIHDSYGDLLPRYDIVVVGESSISCFRDPLPTQKELYDVIINGAYYKCTGDE